MTSKQENTCFDIIYFCVVWINNQSWWTTNQVNPIITRGSNSGPTSGWSACWSVLKFCPNIHLDELSTFWLSKVNLISLLPAFVRFLHIPSFLHFPPVPFFECLFLSVFGWLMYSHPTAGGHWSLLLLFLGSWAEKFDNLCPCVSPALKAEFKITTMEKMYFIFIYTYN